MEFLKAYGAIRGQEDLQSPPVECATVSVQASPEVLRELSLFFSACADRLEASGATDPMVHFHLMDEWSKWKPAFSDFVIVAPPKSKKATRQA